MARFKINNTDYGIYQDGNVNCSNVFKSNIINNLDNKVNLIKSGGEVGSIFIGQKYILNSGNTENIPILKATRNINDWGACYCEFIICGVHSGIPGFVRKCEFMMTTSNNTEIKIFQNPDNVHVGLSNGAEISSTIIGQTYNFMPSLPKITQSPTNSGVGAYMTFYVVPPNTNSSAYNVFFRIMNGGETTYTYTILQNYNRVYFYMSAFTTPGNYGYSINGQLSSYDISCNLITNANKNKIQFMNLGGTIGSIFIGQKLLFFYNKTEIPVLRVTLLQGSSYGGCHCEFIICGTHNNIDGFLIKYEFMLNQYNTEAKIFLPSNDNISIESTTTISGTTIGWNTGPGYMVLPKLTHTNTGSGLNSYKTFSVVPAQTSNVELNQSLYGKYTMFFRMSLGGMNTFTYEIL